MEEGAGIGRRAVLWTRIGARAWGRSLRGRCHVGSQRSVNSGDVMQARWRKGEPVVPPFGVGGLDSPRVGVVGQDPCRGQAARAGADRAERAERRRGARGYGSGSQASPHCGTSRYVCLPQGGRGVVAELAAAELPGSQRKGKPGRHPPLSPCSRIQLALPGFFTLLGGKLEEKDETPPLTTPYPYNNLNIRVYDNRYSQDSPGG